MFAYDCYSFNHERDLCWLSSNNAYVPQYIQDCEEAGVDEIIFTWRMMTPQTLFFTNWFLTARRYYINRYLNYNGTRAHRFGVFSEFDGSVVVYQYESQRTSC